MYTSIFELLLVKKEKKKTDRKLQSLVKYLCEIDLCYFVVVSKADNKKKHW